MNDEPINNGAQRSATTPDLPPDVNPAHVEAGPDMPLDPGPGAMGNPGIPVTPVKVIEDVEERPKDEDVKIPMPSMENFPDNEPDTGWGYASPGIPDEWEESTERPGMVAHRLEDLAQQQVDETRALRKTMAVNQIMLATCAVAAIFFIARYYKSLNVTAVAEGVSDVIS